MKEIFDYLKKIIMSCKTKDQFIVADDFAYRVVNKMRKKVPFDELDMFERLFQELKETNKAKMKELKLVNLTPSQQQTFDLLIKPKIEGKEDDYVYISCNINKLINDEADIYKEVRVCGKLLKNGVFLIDKILE